MLEEFGDFVLVFFTVCETLLYREFTLRFLIFEGGGLSEWNMVASTCIPGSSDRDNACSAYFHFYVVPSED